MEKPARYYFVFARGSKLRFLSHLDMMRLWERALRRAGLPLRYSSGFHPHARISLALPLAVGMTARREWMEVELNRRLEPEAVKTRLSPQLPVGLELMEVREAPPNAPALTTRLQGAEYEVEVVSPPPREAVEERLGRFLEADSWPVQEERRGQVRTVDLRRAVCAVVLGDWSALRGRLRVVLGRGHEGSARLEQLLGLLGLPPRVRVERVQLFVTDGDEMRGDHERGTQDPGGR